MVQITTYCDIIFANKILSVCNMNLICRLKLKSNKKLARQDKTRHAVNFGPPLNYIWCNVTKKKLFSKLCLYNNMFHFCHLFKELQKIPPDKKRISDHFGLMFSGAFQTVKIFVTLCKQWLNVVEL